MHRIALPQLRQGDLLCCRFYGVLLQKLSGNVLLGLGFDLKAFPLKVLCNLKVYLGCGLMIFRAGTL